MKIATEIGIGQQTVSDILKNTGKRIFVQVIYFLCKTLYLCKAGTV